MGQHSKRDAKGKSSNSAAVEFVTVYLATRNSTGIHERVLHVRDDGRIIGHHSKDCGTWRYLPLGFMSDFGTGRDWRLAHCFKTYDEAKSDYIALEKARAEKAQAALRKTAA